MRILTVIGARPQFIKAATVSREILEHDDITEVIVHTGQHYDANMSQVFFDEMKIPNPAFNLSIKEKEHGAMTGLMMRDIENVCLQEKPDVFLVYGDTNSTLAGALVASKRSIPLVHVEAGLRSHNMKMPEEINRILTDRISNLLCCPTQKAVENLRSEGFESFRSASIILSGDVMEDAVLFYKNINTSEIHKNIGISDYCLATVHRAENTDDHQRFTEIVAALNEIAESKHIVIPVHPRIKKKLDDFTLNPRIVLLDPVGYFDMLKLTQNAKLILTDSGGLQKEAFFASKFCVTLRDETEWVELVENGYNVCVGAKFGEIIKGYEHYDGKHFIKRHNLYGGGRAAKTIVEEMKRKFL